MQLKPGTLLQGGKYEIERVIGQGGFGITYLASQVLYGKRVCIKEFFFKDYCIRNTVGDVTSVTEGNRDIVDRFLNKFLKEAKIISSLNHPNIVRILDVFEENNTAYYVMEYVNGYSLADRVNKYGALNESDAVGYIKQVAGALDYIHQQRINHLDVKPANIMIRRSDNKAILIDFGVSKQYDVFGGQTSTTPVGISHGYAPMEQYNAGGVSSFSPQTDIYSLGATLYKLVTGKTPPQAGEILNDGVPELPSTVSENVAETIKKSMQARKLDRYNNIEEFLNGLNAPSQKISFTQQETKPGQKEENDEETKIIDDSQVKAKDEATKTIKTSHQGTVKISEVEENGSKKGWIVILVIAVILGIIGYNFVENKNEERARIEAAYNKKQEDKRKYLNLMGEGDKLLSGGYYTESVAKYEQALAYETMYSNTQYVAEFSKGAANKITEAKRKHEEVQQRLEKEKRDREAVSYNKKQEDKRKYLNLMEEGDRLLSVEYYTKSVAKYEQALAYETMYSNTQYVAEFSKGAANKITEAKRKHEEVQQRLEKEKRNRETTAYNRTHGVINGHEYVDLGLPSGIKWATCNIGANKPEDYGNYYEWSEINTVSDGPSYYSATFHKTMNVDIGCNPKYDAARANWGGSWRMPSKKELQELGDECTWTWTRQGDKTGCKVTGPNGNSIFLPAAGHRTGTSLYTVGFCGYYWSSTPRSTDFGISPYIIHFDDDEAEIHWQGRTDGLSIRPVSY